MTVLSLELNELNFHFVQRFVERGKLPNFKRLLEQYNLTRTFSEKEYPYLEPWIQWPTVYSGKSFAEHRVFRLGDVVGQDYPQIWETLESEGLRVGAVSPMNAANRCQAPCFFLPDPWTATKIVADPKTEKLWKLVSSVVNSNASDDLGFASLGRKLGPLAVGYVNVLSTPLYMRVLLKAMGYKWAKAAFLDVLLFDLTMSLIRRHQPDFVSVFLNAGAHIQHHHTFDSSAYEGDHANPKWYSSAAQNGEDPLLFIYSVYDEILAHCMRRDDLHVLITTGLSQIANPREQYQYRITAFEQFLGNIGIPVAQVEPRMSRDFLVSFDTRALAVEAIARMKACTIDGLPMFTIEDRDLTLFCQIGYFGPPDGLKKAVIRGQPVDISGDIVLVSIENAIHQTLGYHVDTHVPAGKGDAQIPLCDVFERLKAAALNTQTQQGRAAA